MPDGVKLPDYNGVIIWNGVFGVFITAAALS